MIVIDASLALDIAMATVDGEAMSHRLRSQRETLAAPELIELEVLQALRRQLRDSRFGKARAEEALLVFAALEIERFSHVPLRARIFALRDNLTAYDAAYFALAELLDATLWTRDAKFRDVPGARARVEIL
ncbi:MAG: type II toxin-antitoxin system VapC family toxin [Parvularculaceae bacterium]